MKKSFYGHVLEMLWKQFMEKIFFDFIYLSHQTTPLILKSSFPKSLKEYTKM